MRNKMAVLLSLLVVLLTACGSGTAPTTDAPKDSGGAAPSTPAKPQTPLSIALGADTRTLTPMKIVDGTSNQQIGHIYDVFLVRDEKTMAVGPNLAESWRNIDDLTWEFKLRRGIKFHNGEEFDAESVKATILAIQSPAFESHYKARFDMIIEIQTPDPYTVILKTEKPSPILLLRIAELMPMPPKFIAEKGPDALQQTPIGVGAYKFVSHVKDERLELEANPDYWGGKPQIEKVVFRPIPEFSTRLSALMAGEVDLIQSVPSHAVSQVNNSGRATVRSIPSSRINYINLNNLSADSPFNDIRVRQAMNYAVNVDDIIKFVLDGQATRMAGALGSINPDVNPNIKPYPFDVARAKALLADAGVDPTKLTLTLDSPRGRYPMDSEISEAIAAELKKNLGITVNVVFNEWGTHLDKIVKRNTGEMFMLGWGPALDAEGTIGDLFVHDRTYSGFGDPALEQLITAARPVVDPAARREAWNKVQEEVYKQAGWIFLWQQHDLYGVSDRVEFTPRADERLDAWRMKLKD
jgi:peptide/nickel transport system substrate-binding protein